MSARTTTTAGRRAAASLMNDQCTIRRRGAEVLDPVTLLHQPSWTTVYEGACRLTIASSAAEQSETEGQLLTGQQWVLSLPYDLSAAVTVDDVAEISSQDLTVRISGRFVQTHATARRLPVEVQT